MNQPPAADAPGAGADMLQAKQLLRAGRGAEAERLCASILELQPVHAEALNLLAMAALSRNQAAEAVRLLERAALAQPADTLTQHNLGLAHRAIGNRDGAAGAFRRALAAAPDSFMTRLHLGEMLEQGGQAEAALRAYFEAVRIAQSRGQWLNVASTSPGIRPLVEHAMRFVNQGRRRLYGALLEPLRQRHGAEALRRVEACLAIYLGEAAAEYPDPRQRPNFLYFPSLPPSPYLERRLFPWVEAFEQRTGVIRDELRALLPQAEGRQRVFGSAELEDANLRGSLGKPGWEGYYFYRHGLRHAGNCASCPQTAAALEAAPLAHLRDHGPEVLFSLFAPGTHLLPHRGVTNVRVVAHLPLVIPADCALRVGGEEHHWREGRCVFFDDTYEHEAWNRSTELRAVLIFDLWNPHLTGVEREAVSDLIAAIGDFRMACAADHEAPGSAAP